MHQRWFSGLVILAAAISIGCGGGSGTKPEVLAGELAVTPASLSFRQGAGRSESKQDGNPDSWRFQHQGDVSQLERRRILGKRGSYFRVIVAAGEVDPSVYSLAPTDAGTSPGNISFVSDASNSPHGERFNGSGTAQSGQHAVDSRVACHQFLRLPATTYTRGSARRAVCGKMNPLRTPPFTYTDASVQPGRTYFT